MACRITFKIRDYSGESSGLTITGPVLTGANYEAQAAEAEALATNIQAISAGEVASWTLVADAETVSGDLPTDPTAQRELKMMFTFADVTTGTRGSFTVPCPNFSAITLVPGSDAIVLADSGVMAAFVTAVEGFMQSLEGHNVNILSGRIVGRNL